MFRHCSFYRLCSSAIRELLEIWMHPDRCSYYRFGMFDSRDTELSVRLRKSHKYRLRSANKFLLISTMLRSVSFSHKVE